MKRLSVFLFILGLLAAFGCQSFKDELDVKPKPPIENPTGEKAYEGYGFCTYRYHYNEQELSGIAVEQTVLTSNGGINDSRQNATHAQIEAAARKQLTDHLSYQNAKMDEIVIHEVINERRLVNSATEVNNLADQFETQLRSDPAGKLIVGATFAAFDAISYGFFSTIFKGFLGLFSDETTYYHVMHVAAYKASYKRAKVGLMRMGPGNMVDLRNQIPAQYTINDPEDDDFGKTLNTYDTQCYPLGYYVEPNTGFFEYTEEVLSDPQETPEYSWQMEEKAYPYVESNPACIMGMCPPGENETITVWRTHYPRQFAKNTTTALTSHRFPYLTPHDLFYKYKLSVDSFWKTVNVPNYIDILNAKGSIENYDIDIVVGYPLPGGYESHLFLTKSQLNDVLCIGMNCPSVTDFSHSITDTATRSIYKPTAEMGISFIKVLEQVKGNLPANTHPEKITFVDTSDKTLTSCGSSCFEVNGTVSFKYRYQTYENHQTNINLVDKDGEKYLGTLEGRMTNLQAKYDPARPTAIKNIYWVQYDGTHWNRTPYKFDEATSTLVQAH